MSFLSRIFGEKRERARYRPLYDRVVAAARDPSWYREGQVPDTIDGRFDMVAAILAMVLLRLERESGDTRQASVLLTELFIEDMDGSVRQLGIGDMMVGKHVGRMVGALGGRLSAFREAAGADLEGAVRLNIFHEAPPSPEAVTFVSGRLRAFRRDLDERSIATILNGELPPL